MENVPYLNRSYTSILLINLLFPCPRLRRAVPAPLQPPPRQRHQPFGLFIPPSPGGEVGIPGFTPVIKLSAAYLN